MIIVNADDFGKSTTTNRAIMQCFSEGVISSSTILANMPFFEEACEMIFAVRLEERIGIHLNITEGQPLSDSIRQYSRFCDRDGNFRYGRSVRHILSAVERIALAKEFNAQIERVRGRGLPITHADSHHHVHTDPAIFSVLGPVLRQQRIHFVRLSLNAHRMPLVRRVLKFCFNAWIRSQGFHCTRYSGDLDSFVDARRLGRTTRSSFEIMVHPDLDSNSVVVDTVSMDRLMPKLRGALENLVIRSYPLLT